ncbi:hypothetical protein GTA08_BOTSDO01081 [Neofusicoccum parvum]|uniref:Uncharacterized protein n=1 Tax=Neofusicoccum parvum TaxID=310453 RepID=A0ACB5S5R5_9PEZI|nr:hypothetical protein GTA08_BOTSDO01081 [Neofusicoccum parvum]
MGVIDKCRVRRIPLVAVYIGHIGIDTIRVVVVSQSGNIVLNQSFVTRWQLVGHCWSICRNNKCLGLCNIISPTAPSSPNATPPLFQCPADNGKVVSAAGQTFQIRCGVSIGLRLAVPRLFDSGNNDIALCLGTCVLLGTFGAGLDLNLANQNNCQCYTESTDLVVDPSKVAAVLIPNSAVPTLAVRLTLSLPFPTATPSLAFVKLAESVSTHDPSIYADSFFKLAHHQRANKHPFCLSRTALFDSAERLSSCLVGTNDQCAKSISIDRIAFGLSTDCQLALVERSVR